MHPGDFLFCLVSFEGPDDYARVGGLAERVSNLARELAGGGYETHLVFFGDPQRPAVQRVFEHLTLHRWAQWLSAGCPGGVYQAETARRAELANSLPAYLLEQIVRPMVRARFTPVIVAAEWQTFDFLQALDRLLRAETLHREVLRAWDLAAPSVGRVDLSLVPDELRLLGRDPTVIEAALAAGKIATPVGAGAGDLLAALEHPGTSPAPSAPPSPLELVRSVTRRSVTRRHRA